MPDYQVSKEGLRGYLSRISGYLKQKQPKTCVWVSTVGGKGILQRSQTAKALISRKLEVLSIVEAIFPGHYSITH